MAAFATAKGTSPQHPPFNSKPTAQQPQPHRHARWASALLDPLQDLFPVHKAPAVVRNELVRAQSSSRITKATSLQSLRIDDDDDDEDRGKPNRWVDFFCIVGLDKAELPKDCAMDETQSLQPRLLDSFPKPTATATLQVPEHLPTFCFPHGYRPVRVAQRRKDSIVKPKLPEPDLHTIVLTLASGHRLYGTILTLYDQLLLSESEMSATKEPVSKRAKTTTTNNTMIESDRNDLVFMPKCYVLLSHYPFFHAQSTLLQELYGTLRSGTSPLPLERYVAHMVHDIPLPIPGRTRIDWQSWRRIRTTTTGTRIARPAPNQLPLCNVSFEPLLRTLSLANSLVVWATLLAEGKVVLTCSSDRVALLTPLCEALLALLCPLTWQGMYIPVVPSSGAAAMDLLEAPIPYLVGMALETASGTATQFRPPVGVVWCDLDNDIVHLGWKDDGRTVQATLPDLPDAASLRLLHDLEPIADPLYLPPPSGLKGRITIGHPHGGNYLENISRHPYAQMTQQRPSLSRAYILSQASKLPQQQRQREQPAEESTTVPKTKANDVQNEQRRLYRFFPSETDEPKGEGDDIPPDENVTEIGSLYNTKSNKNNNTSALYSSLVHQHRVVQAHTDRLFSVLGQNFATPSPYLQGKAEDEDLLERQDGITQHFYGPDDATTLSVRTAFFRFFLRVLGGYSHYLDPATKQRLDNDRFVRSLSMSHKNQAYVRGIVESQMFALFLQRPRASRRKLFDAMALQRQQQQQRKGAAPPPSTRFLDTWPDPPSVMGPPLPCTRGIPHFGRRVFRTFPDHLDPKECVTDATYYSSLGSFCSVFTACTG